MSVGVGVRRRIEKTQRRNGEMREVRAGVGEESEGEKRGAESYI